MDRWRNQRRSVPLCFSNRVLDYGPAEQPLRTSWCYLHFRYLLHVLGHRIWLRTNMAPALCHSPVAGDRDGAERLDGACLYIRELTIIYPRRLSHVVAHVDCIRRLSRLLRQSGFLPDGPTRVALSTWLCLSSRSAAAHRDLLVPESPRWLMKKNRYEQAYESLCRLRNSELQACRDLFYIHSQLEKEFAALGKSSYCKRFIELFTIPRIRRATVASFTVMISQQMCGINIIAFYSSTIFRDAGYSTLSALLASMGFGLVAFISSFPAVWSTLAFGRRNLLLLTFPNMAWSLLAAGLCFLIPSNSSARVPLIALFIYIFTIFYNSGGGPVPSTYAAEAFPLTHREMGMSWSTATCLFWSSVLSVTFPRLQAATGSIGAFSFYAGCNVVAFLMIFFLVPETKQRSLEELDYVFSLPTRTHVSHQVNHSLPYFFKRWILQRKDTQAKSL
ncbi:unnamed protein product [Mycena citricolor]|uniref:Major facilitator superfamily (MFS) profile domain-containing protein n=1 Tax=Mycena citricolor TaxID=2018698 RepID=A0AAD2HLG7_9AGAR|nr:unnamed protein product [Mycena citricolor]